ncbi:unnamed protein product [Sphenostylis stenocarpa]|uniref:Uncharacterized protein n=1 Tax=Sphenostylis stenocarpa TaxID=92480 RepID=A0AA86V1B7_9FABA|nr:unnamed protein product [Sphenostylis stenocarpa]
MKKNGDCNGDEGLELERSFLRRLNLEREGPLVGALHFAWGARLSSYMLPCNAGLWFIISMHVLSRHVYTGQKLGLLCELRSGFSWKWL